ncbi:DUF2510 domain-containing protein [uncultured Microbacterium sp.]|uniref:DUF2510 domain-containing protein n=1 Tax=uncultured Microbacterium sp. TaxID=191216 RepID=UPI0025EDE045|nr:DUF2510 domain-containing protein [uncultured Microbacterium sp.]
MTDTPTPPDGWYPDPAGGGGLRRWNGTGWTDEVRSATESAAVHDAAPQPGDSSAAQGAAATEGSSHDISSQDISSSLEPQENSAGTAHEGASVGAPAHEGAPTHEAPSAYAAGGADSHDTLGHDGAHDAATPLTASEPAARAPHDSAAHESASHDSAAHESASHDSVAHGYAASESATRGSASYGSASHEAASSAAPDLGYSAAGAAAGAGVPPVAPPTAPVAPPTAPAYTSAPAFPGAPASSTAASYPSASAYAAGAAGAGYAAGPGYPSAPPVSYDTAAPRRDIKTNTVWVWLMVFLPVLSLLGVVIFDWSSFFRDAFYAGVYSYDSGPASMAGTNAATALITVVTSVVSIVVSALTVLFAFLDWRQLRSRGVDRPFHWAFSFFVLAIGSGLVYIIGRGVILRRRTGSGLGPIWASIAVNVAVVIAFVVWAVILVSQITTLIGEFSPSYGY